MLFEEKKSEYPKASRPALPADYQLEFQVGFLFNFISSKSTRFDLEPVLIYQLNGVMEYRRISLQVEKGLAFLQNLEEGFYQNLLQFSDNQLLSWMTRTGNRFIRNHSGSWAHVSAKELINLRKHYVEILKPLWPKLAEWPHLFFLKEGRFSNSVQKPIKVSALAPELRFTVDQQGELVILRLSLLIDKQEVPLNVWGGCLLENKGVLYLPADKEDLAVLDLFKNGPLSFPASVKKEVVKKYILPWLERYTVAINPKAKIVITKPELAPRVRLSELNESNLMIRPEFLYEEVEIEYSEEPFHVQERGQEIIIVTRNKDEENKLYDYLRTLHPSFSRQRNHQYYYLPFEEVMKRGWFINLLRKLQEEGLSIHGFENLKKFRYTTEELRVTMHADSLADSFKLKVEIRWGEQSVSLKEIRQAILNHQHTIMLEDGTLGHIPDTWISQYSLLFRTATEENGTLILNKIHFSLLEDLLHGIEGKSIAREIEERKTKLLDYDTVEKVKLSREIKASLRPYQLSGFHWLQALDEIGWGGCLADDMGLGKTLQTISFLQYLKDKYQGSTQLVICPTSLIFNWENELQKFCPSLKYHIHYGTQRELKETHFKEYDVVLTTYGVVRNDLETLAGFLWQYLILDESQAIKNPDARVTKAVKELRAVNRLILSGTPVQNNTSDLFAQFNFLNPGLLGNREYFNREFGVPIDKFGSKEKTAELKKLIYPFTLRRTKEQVAKDLPDKTVSVLWCTMEAGQRRLYNHYKEGYKKRLLKKIDDEGLGKSGMDVLEALLRLRQICDHPALVEKTADADSGSVKIEELIREVQENAGNHKLLVFSQFTQMLHLIREEFIKAGITFCYLDGQTSLQKRKEEVTRFQEDENIKAFLISLKAGGVGLNLTTADYVYLVDPWWNPAAEQQAIDRAHRIGQTRKVFAYKMICKDSIEEKILRLQEKKKMLADDLIQEEAGFVKSLTRDDIEFLFG